MLLGVYREVKMLTPISFTDRVLYKLDDLVSAFGPVPNFSECFLSFSYSREMSYEYARMRIKY